MEPNSTDLLKLGDTGDSVKRLQDRLRMLGFTIDADGIFGPATETAVRNFQSKEGLEVDGIVGPNTSAKLYPPVIPIDAPTPDHHGMNAIARGMQFRDRGRYCLGAGGVNPQTATPFTWKGAVNGCDCIGFVCWCLGIPRSTPQFPEYQGDIGVDSAMMDAGLIPGGAGKCVYFAPVDRAKVVPGTIVCYPSIRAHELWPGKEKDHGFLPSDRVRIGHIGFVAGWDGLTDPHALATQPWDGDTRKLVTLECRATYPAVRFGRNASFIDGTHYARGNDSWTNPAWSVQFMQYVGP